MALISCPIQLDKLYQDRSVLRIGETGRGSLKAGLLRVDDPTGHNSGCSYQIPEINALRSSVYTASWLGTRQGLRGCATQAMQIIPSARPLTAAPHASG
jgi:hypothetical protein